MRGRSATLVAIAAVSLVGAACGSDDTGSEPTDPTETQAETETETVSDSPAASAIQVVSVTDAAATIDDPPADLVILDVRTAEEFAEGHIEGAIMIDFYRDDFAEQIAALDRDVPYLVYCRSGNRSGQTRELMAELGFGAVDDVDGGMVSWVDAGLPMVVTE